MSTFSVDTPSSLAWREICELTGRPSEVLQNEWGVDNRSLAGPVPGSPDERFLFAHGKMLILTREKTGGEVTAYVKDLARVRRFRITIGDSGRPLLTGRDGKAKTISETLDELVGWLRGRRAIA
jgi:hypothetical protein